MTARTLEEIEELAAEATPGPWKAVRSELRAGRLRICSNVNAGDSSLNIGQSIERAHANTELMAEIHNLLAIAQEQRGAMNADEERTREAAMRVWGEHVRGCDTADAMADLIVSQRAELDAVFAAIDEVDAACEDQAFGWSLRKDTARKRLQALRDKRKTGTKR